MSTPKNRARALKRAKEAKQSPEIAKFQEISREIPSSQN